MSQIDHAQRAADLLAEAEESFRLVHEETLVLPEQVEHAMRNTHFKLAFAGAHTALAQLHFQNAAASGITKIADHATEVTP